MYNSSPNPTGLARSNEACTYSRVLFRTTVYGRYYQLWQSRSVKDLTLAWINCVQGHEMAWRCIGPLYAPLLSDTALMIQYGDQSVSGLLVDWDHAAEKKELERDSRAPFSQIEPFLPIDILYGRPWGHLYRYGLESFVYILVWAAIHYDLKGKKRAEKVHEALSGWVTGTMVARGNVKDQYVNSAGSLIREAVEDAVQDEFMPVLDKIITPLLELLSSAYYSKMKPQRSRLLANEYDYDTCAGTITFDKFMRTIRDSFTAEGQI